MDADDVMLSVCVLLSNVICLGFCRDHAGGNKALVKEAGKLMVFGGDDRIDGLTHKVKHGDQIKVPTTFMSILACNSHLLHMNISTLEQTIQIYI